MILKNTDKTDVRITMKTCQDGENFEHTYTGTFSKKSGKTYLNYRDGNEPCSLITDGNEIRLVRMTSGTRMVFEKGARHDCFYPTPIGNIPVAIETYAISHDLEMNNRLKIRYKLYVEDDNFLNNEINITIEEI